MGWELNNENGGIKPSWGIERKFTLNLTFIVIIVALMLLMQKFVQLQPWPKQTSLHTQNAIKTWNNAKILEIQTCIVLVPILLVILAKKSSKM